MPNSLRTIKQSLKLIFRYCFVSFSSSGLDFLIFILMQKTNQTLVASFVIARLISSSYGYPMAKRFVFRSSRRVLTTAIEYYALVILSGALSYHVATFIIEHTAISHVVAKAIAETLFFIINFLVQRFAIFFRLKKPKIVFIKSYMDNKQTSPTADQSHP